jgi:Surfeit locus protein 5 subunit 22 of Mediator complex
MNIKENLHEQADNIIKDLNSHLKKIIESLEIGNGCEEAECLVINTSTRSFLQTSEDLLEFINQLKLKMIIGSPVNSENQANKDTKNLIFIIKKHLANMDVTPK